jgi:enoyl-CoA hydratase/carnithine racemase
MTGEIFRRDTGPVATIWLNRPDKLNALSPAVFAELGRLMRAAAADPAVEVVVLRGKGRAFAAGADIGVYVDLSETGFKELIDAARDAVDEFAKCPKPVIAAVRGFALGGGFELVLACDLVVAATNARFGLPEAGLGLLPGGGGTQRLPRLVGRLRANELIMTRRVLTGAEAHSWGLVNRLCDRDELDAALEQLISELRGSAPQTLALAKRLVAEAEDHILAEGLIAERDTTAPLIASTDGREGVTAFVERRPPRFASSTSGFGA